MSAGINCDLYGASTHIEHVEVLLRGALINARSLSVVTATFKLAKARREVMYLKWTSEFIKFLADQDHTIEEVLAHLVLRVMAPLESTSAFISQLDNQNSVVIMGRFGITADISHSYEERFLLSERLPITDAIRERKVIAINTLPQWPKEYAQLSNLPYPTTDTSFVAFPIERSGTPVAVAAIFFKAKLVLNEENRLFIQSIANLLALYLYSHKNQYSSSTNSGHKISIGHHSERGLELTQRQLLILSMISEGRTNISIGEMLKYSESTIRQETIKIFSKLGCDGREEASDLYKKQVLATTII